MSELKIGDRVRIVSDPKFIEFTGKNSIIGMTGTVKELNDICAGVEFDDYMSGHRGAWNGKTGYCWYILYKRLEKIEETEAEPKAEEKEVEKMEEKTLKQKILELLRKEIGVEIDEEFEVYEITDSLYKNKKEIGYYVFRGNKFICNENGDFHESNLWKDIAANIYKYEFRKRPFVPKQGEAYYSLFVQSNDCGELVIEGVAEAKWIGLSADYQRFAALNVFKTEEEALRNKDKFLKRLNELLRTEYV